jgi:hypothetical protein
MNIFGDNTIGLIIICVAVCVILQIFFNFVKWIFTKEDIFVEELISEQKYYEDDNSEPYFKRHYKKTYNSGKVEYITSED